MTKFTPFLNNALLKLIWHKMSSVDFFRISGLHNLNFDSIFYNKSI